MIGAPEPGFLTMTGNGAQDELAKIRLVDLAETLFNLRKTKGVTLCIERMKTANNPEPSVAELHVGKMLYCNDWDFRFMPDTGVRGTNYDLQIRYFNQAVCADVKCRSWRPQAAGPLCCHWVRQRRESDRKI
jgi:hypothetical protein